ncbi:MAG: hypothetical protein ABJ056_03795 [Halioglobus sp.]
MDISRPKPDRASATWVDPSTPLEHLLWFKQGALGAGAVLDLRGDGQRLCGVLAA